MRPQISDDEIFLWGSLDDFLQSDSIFSHCVGSPYSCNCFVCISLCCSWLAPPLQIANSLGHWELYVHICEILTPRRIGRIRDVLDQALRKLTLYLLTYLLTNAIAMTTWQFPDIWRNKC